MNGVSNGHSSSASAVSTKTKRGEEEEPVTSPMYPMKPIFSVDNEDVKVPDVMYAVKPINKSESDDSNQGISSSSSGGEGSKTKESAGSGTQTEEDEKMNKLEQRQGKILEQLKTLKQVISSIHETCIAGGGSGGGSAKTENSSEASKGGNDTSTSIKNVLKGKETMEENIDVVIFAAPQAPPFSLLFFVNLFELTYENARVSMKTHTHSSFTGTLDSEALAVFNQEKESANFRFTVVWKNVQHCSLHLTPSQSSPVVGEPNIARFLSRLLPNTTGTLNYDCLNWDNLVKVDALLDLAFEDNIVQIMEKELKNGNDFLAGNPTIADLVLYSKLASKLIQGCNKNVPTGVKRWFKNMEVVFGFHSGI